MALKYYFEFTDVKTIVHRVEISNVAFTGSSTQIYGSCSLEYSQTDDTLEAIRGCGLKIELQANLSVSFDDLYSEDERTYSVNYKRDGVTLFNGWLSPDGLFQSYVTDKWFISLNCIDGLGFLNNLSYVEDATGIFFSGKQSALEIITNCLKRTKTPQNILTNIGVYYNGLTQTLDTFANVYFNSNRFVKDDKDTLMQCDEVLRSVLEPFGAVITSYKGEWVIYKPNTLVDNSERVFFSYDDDGVANSPTTKTIDFDFNLGSQVDAFYPHHVNGNQQLSTVNSIGAYRINYKYGLVKSLYNNSVLYTFNDVTEDWTVNNASYINYPYAEYGLNGFAYGFEMLINNPATLTTTSDLINLTLGQKITYSGSFTCIGDAINFISAIVLTDGTTTYYLNQFGEWVSSGAIFLEESIINPSYSGFPEQQRVGSEVLTSFSITSAELPITGDIKIQLFSVGVHNSAADKTGHTLLSNIELKPSPDGETKEGENHTFQRKTKPSSKIKDTKEVFNADNPSDVYIGTIYKNDEDTPTQLWTRFGASQSKPIIQIMGEERMKMYARPLRQFSGDIFGFVNYLSICTINNITGLFAPISYNYDALNNTTTITWQEVLNTNILSDIDYLITFDYGNVVEPTIKG